MFVRFLCAVAVVAVASARESPRDFLMSKFQEFKQYVSSELEAIGGRYSPSEYPYWNFMPTYLGSLKTDTKNSINFDSLCFKKNVAQVTSFDGQTITVEISSTGLVNEGFCTETFLLGAANVFKIVHLNTEKGLPKVTHTIDIKLPKDTTDAETWDLATKGLRFHTFQKAGAELLSNLLVTAEMFAAESTQGVSQQGADLNRDFLKRYSNFDIQPRDASLNKPPAPEDVHSGDFFGVMRFDGLNPMLAWAIGSTTGHTTTAIWIDNVLYVAESTTDSAYWPTDGIQITEYNTWIQQAIAADYQVVYVPLSEASRAKYNETAAVEFFRSVQGLDYGFKTLLWGWIDTQKDNFPCMPTGSGSTACLQWEALETILPFVDRLINQVGDLIWNEGLQQRLQSTLPRTADLFRESYNQGIDTNVLITIPENDNWLYKADQDGVEVLGKNMVCCVFVCNMWKAAGVFGDLDFNCGEQTNVDDYESLILADHYEQIVGTYSLVLNKFQTTAPYAHMHETCPSMAPDYTQPLGC